MSGKTYVYRIEDASTGERITKTSRETARRAAAKVKKASGEAALRCTIFSDGAVLAEGAEALKLIRSRDRWDV